MDLHWPTADRIGSNSPTDKTRSYQQDVCTHKSAQDSERVVWEIASIGLLHLGLTVVIPATWPRMGTSHQVGSCCGWSPGLLGCSLPGAPGPWLPGLWVPLRTTCSSVGQRPQSGWPLWAQSHSHSIKCHLRPEKQRHPQWVQTASAPHVKGQSLTGHVGRVRRGVCHCSSEWPEADSHLSKW